MRFHVVLDLGTAGADSAPAVVDVVETAGGRLEARIGGRSIDADLVRLPGMTSVRAEGRMVEVTVDGALPNVQVRAGGRRWSARAWDERGPWAERTAGALGRTAGARGDATLRSPMPGRVVRVLVQPGEAVEPGRGVVVLEAMKMENEVRAATTGVVAQVHVTAGATVDANAPLVTFAREHGAGGGR